MKMTELQVGMVLAAPVTSLSGVLLVSGGQEVSAGLLTRLRNFAELEDGVLEPVMVLDTSLDVSVPVRDAID